MSMTSTIISQKRWVLAPDQTMANQRSAFHRRQSEAIERSLANDRAITMKNGIPIVHKTKIMSMSPSRTLMNLE